MHFRHCNISLTNGKISNDTSAPVYVKNNDDHKNNFLYFFFRREVSTFAVRFLLSPWRLLSPWSFYFRREVSTFAVRFLLSPWGFYFRRDPFSFAVAVVGTVVYKVFTGETNRRVERLFDGELPPLTCGWWWSGPLSFWGGGDFLMCGVFCSVVWRLRFYFYASVENIWRRFISMEMEQSEKRWQKWLENRRKSKLRLATRCVPGTPISPYFGLGLVLCRNVDEWFNKRFSTKNLFRGWRAWISSAIEQLQQSVTNLVELPFNDFLQCSKK